MEGCLEVLTIHSKLTEPGPTENIFEKPLKQVALIFLGTFALLPDFLYV